MFHSLQCARIIFSGQLESRHNLIKDNLRRRVRVALSKASQALLLLVSSLVFTCASCTASESLIVRPALESVPVRGTLALNQPIAVYNNWSAYDELSDNIE